MTIKLRRMTNQKNYCEVSPCLCIKQWPYPLEGFISSLIIEDRRSCSGSIFKRGVRKTVIMEFPHIGKNCSYSSCNRLDFLPMKCNACKEVFCSDHFSYLNHECKESGARDVQVPACPLCGVPVPGKRGEPPDVAVGAHIDNQCTSDPARERRKKVFTNRCALKGCKAKEMVPLVCGECSLNFCLRHRHTTDHNCDGKLGAKRRQASEAAMARLKTNQINISNKATSSTPVRSFTDVQGSMTEDEALAHALALSMQDQSSNMIRQRVGGEQNSKCTIS